MDVFKIACRKYQQGQLQDHPYGAEDLSRSFENGEVRFDGPSRIQHAIRDALKHELVVGKPDREKAVRLAAVFPTSGLSLSAQRRYAIQDAIDDLVRLTAGELVAVRGGGYDHSGRAIDSGVTLLAVQPSDAPLPWLKQTIRDFRRFFYLTSDRIAMQAGAGFTTLIRNRLFPSPHWKVCQQYQPTALTQNGGFLMEGSFPRTARRYPARTVHVRILAPGEKPKSEQPSADFVIEVRLLRPMELGEESRSFPGEIRWIDARAVQVNLNLLRAPMDESYPSLNPGFEDFVAPYEVTPMLILSLYAELAAKQDKGAIPPGEVPEVTQIFMPALLDTAVGQLLNPDLGHEVSSSGALIVEELFAKLCDAAYGAQYCTLMSVPNWQAALRQYRAAIGQLDNPLVRRGQEPWVGTKKDLAEMFGKTVSALENFMGNFPEIIQQVQPWQGRDAMGAVRFALHPVERQIVSVTETLGERKSMIMPKTSRVEQVPVLQYPVVLRELVAIGYRQHELDEALDLMEARQFLRWDRSHGEIALLAPDVPDLDEVRGRVRQLVERLERLQPILEDTFASTHLQTWRDWTRALMGTSQKLPNPSQLINVDRAAAAAARQLDEAVRTRRQVLSEAAARLAEGSGSPQFSTERLEQAAIGGLFGERLNDVRVELLSRLTTLKSGAESRRTSLARIATSLAPRRQVSDAELAALGNELRSHAAALKELGEQREELLRLESRYRDAERLLADAHFLLNDKILVLGPDVLDERQALNRWSHDVSAEIATRRLACLSSVQNWRDELDRIRERVIAYEQQVKGAHAQAQEQIRATLTDCFHLPAGQLWPPLVYNPLDPTGSYRQLDELFRDSVSQVLLRLERAIEDVARNAGQFAMSTWTASLGGSGASELRTRLLELECSAKDFLEAFRQTRVTALAAQYVLPGGLHVAQIEKLCAAWNSAVDHAQHLLKQYTELNQTVQAATLTREEDLALRLLQRLASQGHGQGVEWTDYLRSALDAGVDRERAWTTVQSLVDKHKVQVQIRVIAE